MLRRESMNSDDGYSIVKVQTTEIPFHSQNNAI